MRSGVMALTPTLSLATGYLGSLTTGLDSVSKFLVTLTACTPGPYTGAQTNCHLYVNWTPVSKVSDLCVNPCALHLHA